MKFDISPVRRARLLGAAAATLLVGAAYAADPASPADKTFVGLVSQGGQYEVEAGKVAAARGSSPVIVNLGILESHDHAGVGAALKRIAAATGVPIKAQLNDEFTQRLAKLKATPKADFDAAYVADMKSIHEKDEGLFVKESTEGSTAYQSFAKATAVLVKAHLGWLNTL